MTFSIHAVKRAKGGADALRAARKIPAVLYGPEIEPVPIAVEYRDFEKLYAGAGTSSLIDFTVDSGAPVKVLIQDVEFEPVKGKITHADFRQINMSKEMEVAIEVEFVGESPAVKGMGGTLVKALDTINVKCLPKDLVSHVTVDLSRLATFDDVINVGSIEFPAGITPMDDAESVLAKVLPPLTEDELKAMEETSAPVDLSKIEVEEKGKKEEEGDTAEGAEAPKKE